MSEASTQPTPEELQRHQRAREELRAAETLLSDPLASARVAAVHLARALAALRPEEQDSARLDWASAKILPTHLAARRVEPASRALRAALAHENGDAEDPGLDRAGLDRAGLFAAIRALSLHLEAQAASVPGPARTDLWIRRGIQSAVALLLILAVGYAIVGRIRGVGPWRGEYFAREDFQGKAIVQRDRAVEFDWKDGPLHPELPPSKVSIRWDTCLQLDEARSIAFQVTSNDGSRLFVDGERLIDNWGEHGPRTRGAEIELDAGTHHLRVEYYDHGGKAMIELAASFDGEVPGPIDPGWLQYPGRNPDPEAPCG